MQRLGLCLLAILSLSACSSTPDRYAFWRDDSPQASVGTKPNLADVPVAPNTQDAKAQMDMMRQRLEADRNNAYLAAQGYPVPDVTPINDASSTSPYYMEQAVRNDELAPIQAAPVAPYNANPVVSYPQQTSNSGNVQYNYGSNDQAYVYGNSVSQYGTQQYPQMAQSAYQQEAYGIMTANPNVSINFDALGGGAPLPSRNLSTVGLTGQPLVYFKHGSASLNPSDRQKLKELAQHIKQSPQSIVVVGHASTRTGIKNPITSREANLKMSAKRASAVMHELARNGVKAQQLNVTAEGDTTASGQEHQDRRVDILFD